MEGRYQEGECALPHRQARRKSYAAIADRISEMLTRIDNIERLEAIGEFTIDHADGESLIANVVRMA